MLVESGAITLARGDEHLDIGRVTGSHQIQDCWKLHGRLYRKMVEM